MSNSLVRANLRSREETGNTVIPANRNRSYFFIVFTVGSGTIELGGGGGKIPIAQNAFYEPYIVPTSEISIESVGGTYIICEG